MFMAVVPICNKMVFKNKLMNEKGCLFSIKENTRNNKQWLLRFDSADKRQKEKLYLACDAYKSKSAGEQLKSLDAYFKKLLLNDGNEYYSVSSNENEEFSEQRDGNFVTFSSSSFADAQEKEVYQTRSSAKGKLEKLNNYKKSENKDVSDLSAHESSDLYLIGVLVSINIAVFLFEIASPVQNYELGLFSLPAIYGAKINHLILLGEWWRLVTPMFLHSGVFHIGLGSWVLLNFGPRVCKAYGSFTFLLIYILGGISGNLTSFLQTPNPTVGGTGPVFAVIGAWLIYQFQNKDVVDKDDSENMYRKAIFATAISFALSSFSLIDDWTHFGAILTGILYGYLTCPLLQMDDKFQKSGQQERIKLITRYTDPWKSIMVFSFFVAVLSSLLFFLEPPVNYLEGNIFL